MKVFLFARDFAPDVGGVQNMLANVAATFEPENIFVLARDCPGAKQYDRASSYKIYRMSAMTWAPKWFSIPMHALLSLLWVMYLVLAERPTLMLCGYAKTNGPFGYLIKKIFNIPYVVFTYGTDVVRYAGKGRLIKKWLVEADSVATISEPVKDFVKNFTDGKANVSIVPLGCGVSGLAPDPPLQSWGDVGFADKQILLTVCRLTPRKGVDTTIEAIALLAKKHPDLLYVVVGAGDDKHRLVKLAKEKWVDDRVIFAGRVSDEDLLRFYSRADIFILASREEGKDIEGFGLVFVEAGAFGVPVIGGDSGGVRQAVSNRHNGLLVDPKSHEAIANAIEQLLSDKDLAEYLGQNGRKLATNVFTWQNCQKALLDSLR